MKCTELYLINKETFMQVFYRDFNGKEDEPFYMKGDSSYINNGPYRSLIV